MAWKFSAGVAVSDYIATKMPPNEKTALSTTQQITNQPANYDTKPDHVLLRAFRRTGDKSLREFIFFRWRKRAVSAAKRYFIHNMPYAPLLSLDDLTSAATIGLLRAIDSFDPDRNDSFLGWMQTVIKWAIIDELRQVQDFPRSIARHRRFLKAALDDLLQVLQHKPSLEDIREHLGQAAFEMAADPLFFTNVFNQAFDKGNNRFFGASDFTLAETILDHSMERPSMSLREDIEHIVLTELHGLHCSVIYQYYLVGYTIPEIAANLRISTTNVSEKRQEALAILRKCISEQY